MTEGTGTAPATTPSVPGRPAGTVPTAPAPALNEVGGAVGQPDLGDQVGGAVDDVTGNVLP